ncbi:hypothetical protein DMB38_33770 [Streptomyces sp. WAC 06738]|uniref:hypothetical protein n=1 Tax=Streptomyces sp. WAC 06738 TaxID=2203210 RepID=UPI000F71EF94|nr:hypothetical protein [Streptomyces sp. WAC 06738]AZM50100.1 hypothetical protein DMB38_33770 [Streptomyces sp. WAC 06738]
MATQTRYCAECRAAFTWTSRSPNRRFCGPRCKARWWRGQNRQVAAGANGAAPGAEPQVRQVPRVPEQPALGTAHACPHCGLQLTVVNVVVPVGDAPAVAGEDRRARVLAADHG